MSKRIGGTSGPIWGTAFLRAGGALTNIPEPGGEEVIAALRAAIEGIKQRGRCRRQVSRIVNSRSTAPVAVVGWVPWLVLRHSTDCEPVGGTVLDRGDQLIDRARIVHAVEPDPLARPAVAAGCVLLVQPLGRLKPGYRPSSDHRGYVRATLTSGLDNVKRSGAPKLLGRQILHYYCA